MTAVGIFALLVVLATIVGLAGLTAIGEHRRGGGAGVVVVAALFFPLAWVAWYNNDRFHGV